MKQGSTEISNKLTTLFLYFWIMGWMFTLGLTNPNFIPFSIHNNILESILYFLSWPFFLGKYLAK